MRYLKENSIKFPYTNFNTRNTLMFYFIHVLMDYVQTRVDILICDTYGWFCIVATMESNKNQRDIQSIEI